MCPTRARHIDREPAGGGLSDLTPRLEGLRPHPLTLHQRLESVLTDDPAQEIVCRGMKRFTYRSRHERVHRLAGALGALVEPGDSVAMMDCDSRRHEHLDCP